MRNLWVLVGVSLVLQLAYYNVQAHPHRSIEETEEDSSSSESDASMTPVVHPAHPAHERESGHVREMTSHEKSHENDSEDEEKNTSTSMTSPDSEPNSDEDEVVKFPKTESLCPARPEEITNIEQECAREYQQWKEMKAKKEMTMITTTCEPTVEAVEVVAKASPDEAMNEDMKMSTEEPPSLEEVSTAPTTTEVTLTTTTVTTAEGEETTTSETEMTTESTTSVKLPTTTAMMTEPVAGRKRKRSTKRKRSCYPATCILKKLKLLDNMGQLNSKQVQKFAVNMTVDGSTNLEQKAVECVKEINDAMIDSSADVGKKVGCLAQKVITCLNKGLTCPIVKVQH